MGEDFVRCLSLNASRRESLTALRPLAAGRLPYEPRRDLPEPRKPAALPNRRELRWDIYREPLHFPCLWPTY